MYGEVLSSASPAALLNGVHKSLVHSVRADPGSIAPKTSQVGAKMNILAQLKSKQVRVLELKKANHDEQSQLFAKLEELDKEIAQMTGESNSTTEETELIWKQIDWEGWGISDVWEKIEDPTVTISCPNTPAKERLLAARHLLVEKREQYEKADQAEIKLSKDITALQTELPRWRRLLFFFSGNGRLLNRHRFACFLAIALVLSSVLLHLSSGSSTGDAAGRNVDGGGAGSVYGMLRAHCDHVPANIDGAYFDFWTIWVLITAYCAVSVLLVSRALIQCMVRELLERAADCIWFICCCRKPTTTQQAGQRCSCCAVGMLICLLSLSCRVN
jgi:hypothetical protein